MKYELSKSNQIVREICHLTKSENLRNTIYPVISDIINKNIGISISNFFETSSIEYSNSINCKSIIRINIEKDKTTEQVLWDILHEYGHYLSGSTQKPNVTREIEAWNRAYNILVNYKELIPREQSFFKYQEICLETYFRNKQEKRK